MTDEFKCATLEDWSQFVKESFLEKEKKFKEFLDTFSEEDKPFVVTVHVANLISNGWLRMEDAIKLGYDKEILEHVQEEIRKIFNSGNCR